jgi:hypothetical protein
MCARHQKIAGIGNQTIRKKVMMGEKDGTTLFAERSDHDGMEKGGKEEEPSWWWTWTDFGCQGPVADRTGKTVGW